MSDRTASHNGLCRTIRDYLAWCGAWELKVLGGLGQRAGAPDILACLAGRFLAVEVKTGVGQLEPAQRAERLRIEAAGGLYVLARSLDDVTAALANAGLAVPGRLAGTPPSLTLRKDA